MQRVAFAVGVASLVLGQIALAPSLGRAEPPRRHGRAPSSGRTNGDRAPQPPAPEESEQDAAQLPEQPNRAEILAGIERLRPRVEACYDKLHVRGAATVRLAVASSGRVTAATVTGPLAGSDTARCVEEAARAGAFRPFRRDKIFVTSTFQLRPGAGEEPPPDDGNTVPPAEP